MSRPSLEILQILQGVDNASAGPTYSVGFLADALAKRGHRVTVAALGKPARDWPYDVELKVFDHWSVRYGFAPRAALRCVKELSHRPNAVLHGHGLWRISNLFPLMLPKGSKAKLVWSPRGMMTPWSWQHKAVLKRPFWHCFQRRALERVDCFHATAASEVDDVRRLGFNQPVAVIPNGVQIPDLAAFPKQGRQLVFLSRLHQKKGVHLLVAAWEAIAGRFADWELLIAGKIDSPYARELVRSVQERNIPRIRFTGEVLGVEKTELLARARLFVLPTFSENFGIAVAEALAHGTPVITTTETPWTDLEHRGCGWCIQPRQSDLEESLIRALERSDDELASMGTAGRRWMQERYGWERIGMMMEDLYQWLRQQGPLPGFIHR